MTTTRCLLSLLMLLGASAAQSPAEPAKRPANSYRSDIDAAIAALRRSALAERLPALGGDAVADTAKILTAMANCHRRYHISDGPVVRPSVEFLVARQKDDGSFGDAAATGWAVTALLAIDPDGRATAAARGKAWLAANRGDDAPFAAVLAVATKADGRAPDAQRTCQAWLADPTKASRSDVAAALVHLVACQVFANEQRAAESGGAAAAFGPAQQRGIDWLMGQQKDGVFLAGEQRSAPLTGFGLMALQSKPKALRTAREQAAIEQGLAFLLGTQNDDGSWGDSLQNYTTCVAVGALDRARDPATARALAKAQRAILAFQNAEANGYSRSDRDYGSIGYGGSQRGDNSNLHFALQALRQTGLPADDEAFGKAVVFLQRTQNLASHNHFAGKVPDPDRPGVTLDVVSGDDGGACYYPGNSSAGYVVRPDGKVIARSYGSMTYALLKGYFLAGVPASDPRLQAAVGWIQTHWDLDVNPGVDPEAPAKTKYQGLFYCYLLMGQALDQCGIQTVKAQVGDHIAEIDWRTALRQKLEAIQRPDGTWLNDQNGRWMESSPMLCTCYALLALERCR